MAIISGLPVIEVKVWVNGEVAVEYDENEDMRHDDVPPVPPNIVIMYIESQNETPFEFYCTTPTWDFSKGDLLSGLRSWR